MPPKQPEPTPYHIILASTSPRRREFLQDLTIPFTAISPDAATDQGEIDETPHPDESPADLVQRLSRLKAETVVNNLSNILTTRNLNKDQTFIVIAADTVVVLDNIILGKPTSPSQATQMLKSLRKQPHHVYTGLTVAHNFVAHNLVAKPSSAISSARYTTCLHKSSIRMRPYTNTQIATYVASKSPLDKAGAYGIQDQSFSPVAQLQGCFSSVMGLPLAELATILTEIGVTLPPIGPICSQHTGVPCCQTITQ